MRWMFVPAQFGPWNRSAAQELAYMSHMIQGSSSYFSSLGALRGVPGHWLPWADSASWNGLFCSEVVWRSGNRQPPPLSSSDYINTSCLDPLIRSYPSKSSKVRHSTIGMWHALRTQLSQTTRSTWANTATPQLSRSSAHWEWAYNEQQEDHRRTTEIRPSSQSDGRYFQRGVLDRRIFQTRGMLTVIPKTGRPPGLMSNLRLCVLLITC